MWSGGWHLTARKTWFWKPSPSLRSSVAWSKSHYYITPTSLSSLTSQIGILSLLLSVLKILFIKAKQSSWRTVVSARGHEDAGGTESLAKKSGKPWSLLGNNSSTAGGALAPTSSVPSLLPIFHSLPDLEASPHYAIFTSSSPLFQDPKCHSYCVLKLIRCFAFATFIESSK